MEENPFKNVVWKKTATLSRPQCVNTFNKASHVNKVLSKCGIIIEIRWRINSRDWVSIAFGDKPLPEPLSNDFFFVCVQKYVSRVSLMYM